MQRRYGTKEILETGRDPADEIQEYIKPHARHDRISSVGLFFD